jgi:4-hydroxy-2-oxoheptanedioate aldolase
MRTSIVKQKLARDEPVLFLQLHLTDPSVFEMASLMGFDCIWMDLEHHSYSLETANNLMRAVRVGHSDIVARPGKGEFMRMGRLLESGATGILYPRCDDAAEAREVVKWSKFAPMGERGVDGSGPDMPYRTMATPDYIEQANEQTFVVVQLEQASAVEHAEEIAAVEGIDGLMLGPADYSVLCGVPGQVHHELVAEAIEKIAVACANTGKAWGRTSGSFDETRALVDQGARLIFQGSDFMMIKGALEALRKGATEAGFSFNQPSI